MINSPVSAAAEPALGYGYRSMGPIPPSSILVIEIELVAVE